MAISYLGEREADFTVAGSGTSQAFILDTGCTTGSTLFLVYATRNTSVAGCSVSDSKGNTWTIDVGPFNGSNDFVMVASTRFNAGVLLAGDTVTATCGNAPNECRAWMLQEFSGVLTTAGYVDVTANNTNAAALSGTTGTTGGLAASGELAIGAFCINPPVDPITADGTFSAFTTSEITASHGGADKILYAQYRVTPTNGAQSCTINWSNTESYQGVIVVYKSTGGVAAPGFAPRLTSPMGG